MSNFNQPTLQVAQELLGDFLIREIRGKRLVGKIVETEAYIGMKDKACHASKGMTERNKPMFGPAGYWYVYFVYGNHFCLNIVTEKQPSAVLIRALEPIKGMEQMRKNRGRDDLCSGPGKLCQALKIDKSLNNLKACKKNGLWIEKGDNPPFVRAKRIGVDYAGRWADKKWRFYIPNSPFVSRH
jgi:DNA-3-methyladenine glycosylase